MCFCSCDEERKIDNNSKKKMEKSIDEVITNASFYIKNTENEELYYFPIPEKNNYDDEELLNMNVIDVSLGIHKTRILANNVNNGNISFHPFFYVNLKNKNNIGVIIQYINSKGNNNKSIHLWEENGVEYLEKNNLDFEIQYLYFIKEVSENDLQINKWLIKYDIIDLGKITLRQFFEKIIPVKGIWLQKNLHPLKHGCIHFCIDAIKNLGIKKENEEIESVKERMKNVLKLTENQNYYEKYNEGFNALFDAIEGKYKKFL